MVNFLDFVKNEEKYYEFIRELRTHKENTSGFLEQVDITPEQQVEYMANHADEYYIALENDIPVGWVGSVEDDIRICTHPDHKGKGIGKFMLNRLMELHPTAQAKVLWENEASMELFMACDFHVYRKDKQFLYYKR